MVFCQFATSLKFLYYIKIKIKNALVSMADKAPETKSYFYEEWNDSSLVYVPAEDRMYQEIRRLSNFVNKDLNN